MNIDTYILEKLANQIQHYIKNILALMLGDISTSVRGSTLTETVHPSQAPQTNKASGGDGIPLELFQILKDNAMKCCTQYASKFGKLSSGHRPGKGQFSFQSQRKAMPKNAQTTAQLHSSHMVEK